MFTIKNKYNFYKYNTKNNKISIIKRGNDKNELLKEIENKNIKEDEEIILLK